VGHLYNYFFLVVFLIGIAIVFLASEFGWRLGTRTEGQAASGNISALEQSLLGLLALIVGFTFLMALTRFEARREAAQ
jgi:mannose/fructose/N-acetylgalactosamine-specific phosphotransferase system component IID